MAKYPRYYRTRIRNAADDADALVLSSYPGDTNPYIVKEPEGDGESFDPITGAPTTGSYTVQVADPETGTNTRAITSQLADVYARQQLLHRKAWQEYSADGSTWITLVVGYITAIRLITAIKFEIGIGQSRRIEASTTVFKEATTLFPGVTSVIGGPVYGGFISDDFLADNGGWTFEVDEDTAVHTKLALVEGFDPRKPGDPLDTFSSTSTAIADFTNDWARKYFAPTSDYSASGIQGYFPGLRARLEPVIAGDAVTLVPLARPGSGSPWWNPETGTDKLTGFGTSQLYLPKEGVADDGTTVAFDPALTTQYYVWVYAVAISNDNPLHWYGHPVDLWENLRIQSGIPYDATVLPALKTLIGTDVNLALRIRESSTLGDFDQKVIYGPFRLSSRIEDGERVLFSTNVTNNAAPTETITINELRSESDGPIGTVFDLDEGTVVTSITLKTQSLIKWSTTEGDQPEIDALISRDAYPQSIENSDDDIPPGAKRDVEIGDIPGTIWIEGSGPISLTQFLTNLGYELFERFGRGAIVNESYCTPDIVSKLGEEVFLDLPHLPGAVVGSSPVSQRGIAPQPFQITQRTVGVEGPVLKLHNSISGVQADAVLPEFTLEASTVDDVRYGLVTITNADDLNADDLDCRCDYAVGVSEPTSTTYFTTILAEFMTAPTFGFDVGPVEDGSTLWVRLRAEAPGFRPGDWTAFQSVELTP